MTSIPACNALCAALTNAATISLIPSFVNAFGVAITSLYGLLEGPTTSPGHPFAIEEAVPVGSQGAAVEALRPPCASWIPI
jgi:hypothetical protein